jgi:predicted amidohydrolase YtcJ
VTTHVDGSATVRATIDAIEASRNAGFRGRRHGLHHYFVVHPDDHQRVKKMEIPVNTTPIFLTAWQESDKQAYDLLG